MHNSLISATLVSLFYVTPVYPQSKLELNELRQEIERLRSEINELKQQRSKEARPADLSGWSQRIEQLEVRSRNTVTGGDINGSFRLPGSNSSARFYGFVEADMIHDLNATAPGDNFTNLREQPLKLRDKGASKAKTTITAETSRFGFQSVTPTSIGNFETKLEMDFYGYCGAECNRNRMRLRHAYGEYAGWLVGQTWSTFMDLDDLPETVDFNGPVGLPFSRRSMIRYTYDNTSSSKFSVALEDPERGVRMPNLVARIDKKFEQGSVNLRILSHEKRGGSDYSKRGYGIGLGGNYKLTEKDVVMGQWAHVSGDYDMMYGSKGYIDTGATLLFDKSIGIIVGVVRQFNDRVRGNFTLGINQSKGNTLFDNRRLTQLHVGVIYSPIKNVDLGAEYVHGTRETFDGDVGTMSRVDLMGRHSF